MKPSAILFLVLVLSLTCPLSELPASPQGQVYRTNARLEASTGIPRALYFQNRGPYQGTPEDKAKAYLLEQVKAFRLAPGLTDLSAANTSESPMGYHVTFRQTVHDIPVYRSDIVVTVNRDDRVVFTVNNYKPNLSIESPTPKFPADEAILSARAYLKVTGKLIGEQSATLMVYAENPKKARLAYRVIVPTEQPLGDWEVFVDASTGEIFSVTDMAEDVRPRAVRAPAPGYSAGDPPAVSGIAVNGTGYVYDPDPLTSTASSPGGGYVDNNDADTPQLDSARVLVTLQDITLSAGKYSLAGPYVKMEDFESPADTFATPASADSFRFHRSEQGFEEATIYYHIDKSQRYIQSLGFNAIQNLSIGVDPHGLNGADNSHYIPSSNRMAFGEGGVDDGEDADVIWHEYGHAIHNGTKPGWGSLGGEARHLGEGFGDYWAGSYSKANWAAGADKVFNWDGTTGAFRTLLDTRQYPRNGVASLEVHNAGQIWSSVLMSLWNDLGRAVMDKLVLQSHYMMGANPTMRDNACAIIQADRSLYAGAHVSTLLDRFISRGFLRVDIEFVIDDTGSMSEEIGGIRDALTSFLAGFSEDTCLIFQLTTFKDNVSSRSLTINLGDIRSQVASLFASGGADCPEASVEALNAVRDTIRNGGVILFATDADPHPGTNINATISNLRARGIRVNVLLSGACNEAPEISSPGMRSSSNEPGRAPSGTERQDPTVGPNGNSYRHARTTSDTLHLGGTDFTEVPLPFPFSFGGKSYNSVFVHADGYVTFGRGELYYYVEPYSMLAGPRIICGLWVDLYPPGGGTITATQVGADFHISYDAVPTYYYGNPVTFTIVLRPDNTFGVTYGSVEVDNSIVGFSAGRSSATPPDETDMSAAAQPIGPTGEGTAYEYFYPDSCDLSFTSLEFAPVTFDPPTGSIAGMVFNDLNSNGVRDTLEPGIAGWAITASGPVYRTTTTDSSGMYLFDELPAGGTYFVQEEYQYSWEQTYPPGVYYNISVDSGTVSTGNDFGNFLGSGIQGYVYFDRDSSASLTYGDGYLSGWMVRIDGPVTDSVVAYSSYTFFGLPPGSYTLSIEPPAGFDLVEPVSGTHVVNIDTAGSSVTGINFGVTAPPASLTGVLFHDHNSDGIRQPGDEGLAGVYMYMSGSEYVYTSTDSSGMFTFPDLIPGMYSLSASLTGGFVETVAPGSIVLAPGEVVSGLLYGAYKPPNSIQAFSRIAAETGGFFAYVPEVNSGDTNDAKRFKNVAFNIVQGGITKSIGLAQPSEIPVGGTVLLNVTGSNTNFINAAPAPGAGLTVPGAGPSGARHVSAGTTIEITGDGITVNSVTVVSPIELVADISVDPGATPGFRDIIAISDLGGGFRDTAVGFGTLRIGDAPSGPTILGISPPTGVPGTSVDAVITGFNTSFADTSSLDLGPGITVSGVNAISPTRLHATLVIDTGASIGFRNVAVTSGPEYAGESVPGPFLVVSAASEIALIADVSPANAMQGDSLTVSVTGLNTNFDSSLTTVSFSGSGIYVQAIRILSPTELETDIVVDSMAPPGYRDVFVSTGVEDATALSAFNIGVLPTDVPEERPLPTRYSLAPSFPNPFNPTTTIRYELPARSLVKLTVYNMLGQTVAVLEDGIREAGYGQVVWDASKMSSGVYLYKLEAVALSDPGKGFTQVNKTVLLK